MKITWSVHYSHTLWGHPLHWCATLLENCIHSLTQLIAEIKHAFHHFDHQALNKEIMKLRKAPNESFENFNTRFCNLTYLFLEDEIDCEFLDGRFKYLIYISKNPQFLESFKPLPAYLGVRATKSKTYEVVVTSDYPSSSHKIALDP